MEAGGGGGDGSFRFGKGGLVAGVVEFFRIALHVVREGERAELRIGHLVPVDETVSVFIDFGDGAGGVTDLYGASRFHLFARAHHGAPTGVGDFFDAKEFDFLIVGEEASGDDFGIVEDEEVFGSDVVGKVAELLVFDQAGVAMDDEHAGGGAIFQGVGGDELRGEVIVEVGRA